MKDPGSKLRDLTTLDEYRIRKGPVVDLWGGFAGDETCGAFQIPTRTTNRGLSTAMTGSYKIRVIVSGSEGWDHISVSLPTRCPTWEEMEHIKRMFFEDDACCMQLHVPVSEHISCHPFCLHIWRPHDAAIPMPPPIFVAPPAMEIKP